jgi:hypothetical protein
MGINPNNKITIIIRMFFAITLFQHLGLEKKILSLREKEKIHMSMWNIPEHTCVSPNCF